MCRRVTAKELIEVMLSALEESAPDAYIWDGTNRNGEGRVSLDGDFDFKYLSDQILILLSSELREAR